MKFIEKESRKPKKKGKNCSKCGSVVKGKHYRVTNYSRGDISTIIVCKDCILKEINL